MKKNHVFLTIGTMLLAIGGAFASRHVALQIPVYEYIAIEDDEFCVERIVDCDEIGQFPCATASAPTVQLRGAATTSNDCGPSMWREQ